MSPNMIEKVKKQFFEYVENRKKLIQDEIKYIENIMDSFSRSDKAILTIWERSLFLFSELFEWISTIMPSLMACSEQFEIIRNSIENLKSEIKPESKEKVEKFVTEMDDLKQMQKELEKNIVKLMQRKPPDIFG